MAFGLTKNWMQSFTRDEVRDIILASLIVGFIAHLFLNIGFGDWVLNWLAASLVAGLSYVIHEIAHKAYAKRLKYEAVFVLNPLWAVASLVVTMFSWLLGVGFVLLLIGNVVVKSTAGAEFGKAFHTMTRNEEGKIAFAGPASNVALAIFFKVLEPIHPVFSAAVQLNLLLAVFNTLPLPKLDGLKLMTWSILPWSALFATEIILLVLINMIPLSYLIIMLLGLWIFLFIWLQKYTKVSF